MGRAVLTLPWRHLWGPRKHVIYGLMQNERECDWQASPAGGTVVPGPKVCAGPFCGTAGISWGQGNGLEGWDTRPKATCWPFLRTGAPASLLLCP